VKRFIEGEPRSQSVLFPERLDDWVAEDNPVRAVDAFVDELGVGALGWRDNGAAIRKVCTQFVELCRRIGLFEQALVAIDGSKFMPEAGTVRRQTVEHAFGTLKAWMGATHFQTKTLPRVRTEMSLHVLAYNLKRVMQMMGVRPLVAAIRAACRRICRPLLLGLRSVQPSFHTASAASCRFPNECHDAPLFEIRPFHPPDCAIARHVSAPETRAILFPPCGSYRG
jgi:hypothetical protein